jgi:hypothetical protein
MKKNLAGSLVGLSIIAAQLGNINPANANVSGDWGFITDTYNAVMNHTIRRKFTQEFFKSYSVSEYDEKYGNSAETEVWYKCSEEMGNKYNSGFLRPVVRKENGTYNCYERKHNF